MIQFITCLSNFICWSLSAFTALFVYLGKQTNTITQQGNGNLYIRRYNQSNEDRKTSVLLLEKINPQNTQGPP